MLKKAGRTISGVIIPVKQGLALDSGDRAVLQYLYKYLLYFYRSVISVVLSYELVCMFSLILLSNSDALINQYGILVCTPYVPLYESYNTRVSEKRNKRFATCGVATRHSPLHTHTHTELGPVK
jgi:hypothetical protein